MLIRTANMDGTVTITGKNPVKSTLLLAGLFALTLFPFINSYNKFILISNDHPYAQLYTFKGMFLGGLGAGLIALVFLVRIWTILNGGNRIILSKDKITRLFGAKKTWASWKSLDMFEPEGNLGIVLKAKIIGNDISDNLKSLKEFRVTMTSAKSDMLELMEEINSFCAKANKIDAKKVREIQTKAENQITQNLKNGKSNVKKRYMFALWIMVFGFGGLILLKIIEGIFFIPKHPFENYAVPVVVVIALLAANFLTAIKKKKD